MKATIEVVGKHFNIVTYKVTIEETTRFISCSNGNLPLSFKEEIKYDELVKIINEYTFTDESIVIHLTNGNIFELIPMKTNRGDIMNNDFLSTGIRIFTNSIKDTIKNTGKIKDNNTKKQTNNTKAYSNDTLNELEFVLEIIHNNFSSNTKFKNKDLAPYVSNRFTSRQLPSRLKKLVDKKLLFSDNSSPKNYWY